MRKSIGSIAALFICTMMCSAAACAGEGQTELQAETVAETAAETEKEEPMISITVKVGENSYEACLYDNESARALSEVFPMTLSMSELNGNEKYHYLAGPLPTNAESIGAIHAGDLMLFGSDCLVLFYENFTTSYRYTRIGYLENPEGLSGVLGSGTASVSFEMR